MKRVLVVVSALLLFTMFASACGGDEPNVSGKMPGTAIQVNGGGTYWRLSASDFNSDVVTNKSNAILINVDPLETLNGAIAGTDLYIPYDDVVSYLSLLPPDKDTIIGVYCLSGTHSPEASEALVKAGYTIVFELSRGMEEWTRQGYVTTIRNP